jgi:hypothetical protein
MLIDGREIDRSWTSMKNHIIPATITVCEVVGKIGAKVVPIVVVVATGDRDWTTD